ncbi:MULTISPECIES: hypothetical protein [Dickeya]|uniref:hypothetical protein n=1 Tax=Dickeya TaxID=204037 RepID=UPI000AA86BB3|nr:MULTISPECIES: hypothetical protein [Dickeya]
MKKALLLIPVLITTVIVTPPSPAATGSITKSSSAQIKFIYSDGTTSMGLSAMYATSTDFPSGTLNTPKKLARVSYEIAAYPGAYTDKVQLCYFQSYQTSPTRCISVPSGTSGTTTQFNDLRFDLGTQMQIRHDITGRPGNNLQPSRRESVRWDYSY